MSLLPGPYLNTTHAFEIEVTEDGQTRHVTVGTGFLVAYEDRRPGDPEMPGMIPVNIFTVTNRHVLRGVDMLTVRVNRIAKSFQRYRLPIKGFEGKTWLCHPDPVADIAVIRTAAKEMQDAGMDLSFFRPSDILTSGQAQERGIGPGQELFVLGFPLGISGTARNYSVARAGMIARLDEEILREHKGYLIDASIYPGNSGGPVIVKPTGVSLVGRQPVTKAYLMGTVRAYIPFQDIAVSQQTGARVAFSENSGLAWITPMEYVLEAIRMLRDLGDESAPVLEAPPQES